MLYGVKISQGKAFNSYPAWVCEIPGEMAESVCSTTSPSLVARRPLFDGGGKSVVLLDGGR